MLVGITGKKRSGKDTAGQYLVDKYGFIKARPIAVFKEAFPEWFGWDERHMNGDLKEEVDPLFGFSPRQIMQVFGTELMKQDLGRHIPLFAETCGEEIWARAFVRWYEKQPPGDYVVTDVRCIAEAKTIPFDTIIRLVSDRSPQDNHPTEKEVPFINVQHMIINNGPDGYDALYKGLDKVMEAEHFRKKVYLSGAISGKNDYHDDFEKWENFFLDKGYRVFNPVKQKEKERHEEYLKADLAQLMKCDFIFFVNDISSSKGAFVEKMVADACGIKELKDESV